MSLRECKLTPPKFHIANEQLPNPKRKVYSLPTSYVFRGELLNFACVSNIQITDSNAPIRSDVHPTSTGHWTFLLVCHNAIQLVVVHCLQ